MRFKVGEIVEFDARGKYGVNKLVMRIDGCKVTYYNCYILERQIGNNWEQVINPVSYLFVEDEKYCISHGMT